MIKLSRLDRQEIAINCDLIAWIEARPDTIVRMVSGECIPVRESVEEIVQRIAEYRSGILRMAGLDALAARAASAVVPSLDRQRTEHTESDLVELGEIPVKKIDIATLAGLAAAFGFILLGNHLEGGHIHAIVQPTAALIVFGGTLGAVLVSFPMDDVLRAVRALELVFGNKAADVHTLIEEVVGFAQLARKEGVLALEEPAERVANPFFKKGLLMVVDGIDSKTLEETLDLGIGEIDERGEIPAKVFEAAGGYAPTIGIVGAVLGLIHVMSNLADVAKVGEGIAVAFVATIYGVGAANIVFLPAANKLKLKHRQEMIRHEIVLHGVLAIQQGQNRKTIVERLSVFAHGEPRDSEKKKEAAKAA